jgi:TonB family protein
MRIGGTQGTYPLSARAAGIEGAVSIEFTITKEGKTENIRVLSGPPELRKAAADAVATWTYVPYRHSGQPVAVDTTVTLNYRMGDRPAEKAQSQAKAKAELARAVEKDSTPQQ